ncbi:MAG: helix-turn-helix domain-containing protein [Acidimicrobiales bacterium]
MVTKLSPYCSIQRSLDVLGERWTILILREALSGVTRFDQFRSSLRVAPDILADRLNTLVDFGVLERRRYREPGARSRDAYHLTVAGEELLVVLSALQQWGDDHLPREGGPTMARRRKGTDEALHVGFIDERGVEVNAGDVAIVRTVAYPV